MSFNLPDTIVLPTSPGRHNIAIAEIVIFAVILPIQLGVRYFQIRRCSPSKARVARNSISCLFRAWLNFVVLFAQIRMVGFALYLAVHNPSKGVVIAEVTLQSVGLSPLLLELSFTLLRCGRAGLADGTTSYPKFLERILQYTRLPLLIAVVLIIVAGSILNLSFLKAGASVITATFIYLCGIAVFISTTRLRNQLNANAQRSLWIALASLPLYTVRVIYLMLVEFGNVRFDPVIGDWRYLASLGFAMEVGIAVLLVMAGIAVEPW